MKKINKILIEVLKISETEVEKDLKIEDVDNWDSLTHMSLIASLEDELKIELTGDEIADMISFDEVRKIVTKHL